MNISTKRLFKYFSAILALIIVSCESTKNNLPVLSYNFDSNGNKINYSISYKGKFKNQNGKLFTNKDLKGKVFIANFFFTRCPSICPPMKLQLTNLAKDFLYHDNFLIVSHTIDPYKDTPARLKEYSISTGIPDDRWFFLTSSEKNTKALAKQYKTNFKPNENGTDFYHSSFTALVDSDGLIRGFYDLLIPNEIELLKQDINTLLNH
ncbi:SCO family protein [Seonamhaeicola sp. ML3]|uniref:SCO family protein n=1 Tax=Seonamhaeicola sp. ML3 TaxID=2937786 RepID=UPI00200EFBEA|nr:SCO family protein [Seonamhaeicola sp. ML3]